MGLDIEDFIKTTIEQPGLRSVFNGEKEIDFIFISFDLFKILDKNLFIFAINRMHDILIRAGFKVILEYPENRLLNHYILWIKNEKFKT